MSDFQTAADFAKHVNTNFRVELESPQVRLNSKLITVTPRAIEPHEQAGMERFSVLFSGHRCVSTAANLSPDSSRNGRA